MAAIRMCLTLHRSFPPTRERTEIAARVLADKHIRNGPGTGPAISVSFAKILVAAGGLNAAPGRLRRALRLRRIGIGQQRLLRSCGGGLRQYDHFRSDLHAIV